MVLKWRESDLRFLAEVLNNPVKKKDWLNQNTLEKELNTSESIREHVVNFAMEFGIQLLTVGYLYAYSQAIGNNLIEHNNFYAYLPAILSTVELTFRHLKYIRDLVEPEERISARYRFGNTLVIYAEGFICNNLLI